MKTAASVMEAAVLVSALVRNQASCACDPTAVGRIAASAAQER